VRAPPAYYDRPAVLFAVANIPDLSAPEHDASSDQRIVGQRYTRSLVAALIREDSGTVQNQKQIAAKAAGPA